MKKEPSNKNAGNGADGKVRGPVLVDNREARRRARKARRRRRVAAGIFLLAALLLMIFREDIDFYRLRRYLTGEGQESVERFAVDFDTNGALALGASRENVVLCSGSVLAVYRQDGSQRLSETVSLSNPAIATADQYALVYERGGSNVYLAGAGSLSCTMESETPVLTGDVGKNGSFAIVTSPPEALSAVEVYSRAGRLRYRFVSSSSYISGVAVSNDGDCLAVAGFSVSEAKLSGVLRFLDTSSEQPTAEVLLPDELILDIGRTGDALFVVTDCALRIYDLKSGQLESEIGFDGQHLLHYTLSDSEGAVLTLGRYTVGQGSTLLHYGADGELKGSTVLEQDVQALSAGHGRVLALLGDGAMLFDANAALLEERQVASVRAGVLLKGGVAALVDGSGVLLLP